MTAREALMVAAGGIIAVAGGVLLAWETAWRVALTPAERRRLR